MPTVPGSVTVGRRQHLQHVQVIGDHDQPIQPERSPDAAGMTIEEVAIMFGVRARGQGQLVRSNPPAHKTDS